MRQAFLDYLTPFVRDILNNDQRLIPIKRKDVAAAFVKEGVFRWHDGGGYQLIDRAKLEELYSEIVRKETFYAKMHEEMEIFKLQQVSDFWDWVDLNNLREYVGGISSSWDSWLIWLKEDYHHLYSENLYFRVSISSAIELQQAHVTLDAYYKLWCYCNEMSKFLKAKRDEQHEEYINFQ